MTTDELTELVKSCWTVSELARVAGVDGSRVRRLLAAGRLKGVKAGPRGWLIFDDSARAWLASPRKGGRPRKGTRPAGKQLEFDQVDR